ncbi:MAG: peptide chain release factor N(5)-glutamine methyltransferase [Rhodospirillales bacterium]|nr:peptide chain release factor N(5)-glutamine methyltransferase [Rhodospirillales bacterium]
MAVDAVAKKFKQVGIDGARLDARLIVTHGLGVEPQKVLTHPELSIAPEDCQKIIEMAHRRIQREPMSHILGEREFWSMDFKVTADTLTPRPDTETLVDVVLSKVAKLPTDSKLGILDLGTGTGCILLTLLSEIPNANGIGVDISEAALSVAHANASSLGLLGRAAFSQGHWGDGLEACFDIVVSNPPYIPAQDIHTLSAEVSKYEPRSALDGGEDGLDAYCDIAADLKRLLKPGGFACFEVGIGQAEDVSKILSDSGFTKNEIHSDLSGIERVVLVNATI